MQRNRAGQNGSLNLSDVLAGGDVGELLFLSAGVSLLVLEAVVDDAVNDGGGVELAVGLEQVVHTGLLGSGVGI